MQDTLAAEAEAQVTGEGLTDEQLTIYSTIGGTPHLDGQYTVFGEVEEGLDIRAGVFLVILDFDVVLFQNIRNKTRDSGHITLVVLDDNIVPVSVNVSPLDHRTHGIVSVRSKPVCPVAVAVTYDEKQNRPFCYFLFLLFEEHHDEDRRQKDVSDGKIPASKTDSVGSVGLVTVCTTDHADVGDNVAFFRVGLLTS